MFNHRSISDYGAFIVNYSYALFFILLITTLSGCAAHSQQASVPAEPGWQKIEVEGIDQARLKVDADWSNYKSVLVMEPDLDYDSRWLRTHRRDMSTTDDNRIRKSYTGALQDALKEAFADQGLTPVTTPSADTIILHARMTEFRLTAPDLSFKTHSRSFVDYAGSARLELVLQDGATNEPFAEFNDYKMTRSFGGFGQLKETNRLVNLRDFRWLARRWSGSIAEYIGGRQ